MAKRGNPHPTGGKPDKLIRDALMLAVNREGEGKTKKLTLIADKLVDLAVGGDVAAIKEVADRIDGKATQAVDGNFTGALTLSWEK